MTDSQIPGALKGVDNAGVSVQNLNPRLCKYPDVRSRPKHLQYTITDPLVDFSNTSSNLEGHHTQHFDTNCGGAVANTSPFPAGHVYKIPQSTRITCVTNVAEEIQTFYKKLAVHCFKQSKNNKSMATQTPKYTITTWQLGSKRQSREDRERYGNRRSEFRKSP